VTIGAFPANVSIDIGGGITVTSSITNEAVVDLGVAVGTMSSQSSNRLTSWSATRSGLKRPDLTDG
jgi:hypothetical protein